MSSNGLGPSALRERPIGEVAHDLTRDLSLLVRQEVELAKSEMTAKGRAAAPGLGMIGAAFVAGLMAAGAMTACAVIVLAIFLPDWLSALLVGAALATAAYGSSDAREEDGRASRISHTRTDNRNRKGGRGMGQDPSSIRAQIEETRMRVGDEVDALSYKTDVPRA